MRGLPGKLRLTIGLAAASILALSLASWGLAAVSQSQEPPPFPSVPGQTGGRVPGGQGQDANPDPVMRRAEEEAAKKRNIDRQNRLVINSNKILQLAQELNVAVDMARGGPPPPALAKKAEEIEKLARVVQARMKSE